MNKTLEDVDLSQFLDKDGKFKIIAFRAYLKEESIKLRESVRNNDLIFSNFTKEQKDAITKFIAWYFD